MKKSIKIICAVFFIFVTITYSCKKDEVPTLTSSEVTGITGTTATAGGIISDEGSGSVIARGVCYGTSTNPTIEDNITSDGTGVGTFTSNITGLNGAKTYFLRAYATNSSGTAYGATKTFTTLGTAPSVVTNTVSNCFITIATLNGEVNANYLSTVVTFEYGTTTAYGNSLTSTESPVTGNTGTPVSVDLTGLTAGTIYHFRIKAVNELGTTYGEDETFTTLGEFIGYYNLEESTGSVLTQAGSYVGTVYGTPARQQAGKNNYCYLLDGTSAINLGDNTYRFTTDFTVSMWINTTSLGSYENFFSRYYSSSGFRCYSAFISPSGEINFYVFSPLNEATFIRSPANSISTGQWYHIALVKSGTSMKIILNNSVVANTNSAPITIRDQEGSGSNLKTFIGADSKSTTTPDTFFHGYIDEVAIWDMGLSDEQITYIWNNGNGRFFPY